MLRNITYQLNTFENGYLHALLYPSMERMKHDCPILWLQLQIEFCKSYAESDGHPAQKQAKKDVKRFKKMLEKRLAKEAHV